MSDGIESDKDTLVEPIQSEIVDADTSPATFEVVTYPADFTLEGLVTKYRKENIIIPGFQRKFVWNINQSSRLIESFLLGLPVPAIFLYIEPDTNKNLVIDGQQRLLSIAYFMEGFFGEPVKGKRIIFRLKGLSEKSRFYEKTYKDLEESDEAAFNKLNDTVLRAFIVKQLEPVGNSSIHHIFERLNTGGTQLVGQEIRNVVFHGSFNDLLWELNSNYNWRKILGKPDPDKRQKDIELILRFIALHYEGNNYTKPMKIFLSNYMEKNKDANDIKLDSFRKLFIDTVNAIYSSLGEKPFHVRAGLNAAMFDAVFVAFSKHIDKISENIKDKYLQLTNDPVMGNYISSATTDDDIVKKRAETAIKTLFG